MKKELNIIFLLLVIILSVSVLAINLPDVSPEKVFGISSGMQTSDLVVKIAVWVIVFFVLYGILRTFFGWFLGVLLSIGSVILLGYFGIASSLLKNAAVIVANLGALGIPLIIILAFIIAVIVPLVSNRLAIWWIRTSVKMRARRMVVFFLCFFIFLLAMQFIVAAQEIPQPPNPEDAVPYALNRTKPIYEKTIDFFKSTCDSIKSPTKYIFGKECSASMAFLIAVAISVFFLVFLYDIFTTFATFSSVPGFFISLGLTLIIVNSTVISKITDWLLFLIGTTTGLVILVGVLILFALAFSFLKKYIKQSKAEHKKIKAELAQDKTIKVGEEINKALG